MVGTDARTMGVEEEFLLVEPATGATVPAVARVLAEAAGRSLPSGAIVQRELRASQVETATGVCATAGELRSQLAALRQALAEVARRAGVVAVPMGTPPLTRDTTTDPIGGPRFARIDGAYAGVTRDYEACGLHVHVGVPDKDTAVAVVNHVNRWLPTLLALSVNSPLHGGRDTGYGSWRVVQQSRFPGSGLAPYAADHQAWQAEVARLVDYGVLADEDQSFWYARPAPRLPTVEFRIADTAATVDDALLQALLSRALVRTALADLERGREAAAIPPSDAQAAVWAASRYGPRGQAVDLGNRVPASAVVLLHGLLLHTRDALADTGDTDEVRALLSGQPRTGAQLQRDLAKVVGVAGVPRRMALSVGRGLEPSIAGYAGGVTQEGP
ncbi:YbdK family carboxylate-amine ligase [Actinokineospora auranticolor]|uniref:Putative glutamate--cysteine ligase 2 n=1 Tax=Actinokineospora auranticolor TaxID=155976 RepID=A0A2S6H1C8_9PSEU|nr:YbdK family carboxylate-amine ligase [Actinokineospora auranticolor]PPK71231.1 carboxylate-amine ligase [Actinokineospora auranticolor]